MLSLKRVRTFIYVFVFVLLPNNFVDDISNELIIFSIHATFKTKKYDNQPY